MKFYGSALLALCVSPTAAFTAQAPKTPASFSLGSSYRSYDDGFYSGAQTMDRRGSRVGYRERDYGYDRDFDYAPRGSGYGLSYQQPGGGISSQAQDIMLSRPEMVQGGSLKTWSFESEAVDRVQVVLKTEGRPLDADVELWQGPDNTPHKMRVYVENGAIRPFNCFIETPRGPNTIAIRNIGQLEFPLAAHVAADEVHRGSAGTLLDDYMGTIGSTIQGGALRTYPFESNVESVQVMLTTDGRPLNARIELMQGPNNNKQTIEIYAEDGMDRPFFMVVETPGSGNVVRVVNSATVEFPMTATVEPYSIDYNKRVTDPVVGGDEVIDTSAVGGRRSSYGSQY